MAFKHELFIPFHLGDPAQILFFAHTFTLAHEAYEQFVCKHLNIPWSDWFQNSDWIVPIKHAEANYIKPLFAGIPCLINLTIVDIKNTSFSLLYQFSQNNLECCLVKTIHVFFNKKNATKQEIPSSIKEKLFLL